MERDDARRLATAQIHLSCARIAGLANSLAEAHRFGVPEGTHDMLFAKPWRRA